MRKYFGFLWAGALAFCLWLINCGRLYAGAMAGPCRSPAEVIPRNGFFANGDGINEVICFII